MNNLIQVFIATAFFGFFGSSFPEFLFWDTRIVVVLGIIFVIFVKFSSVKLFIIAFWIFICSFSIQKVDPLIFSEVSSNMFGNIHNVAFILICFYTCIWFTIVQSVYPSENPKIKQFLVKISAGHTLITVPLTILGYFTPIFLVQCIALFNIIVQSYCLMLIPLFVNAISD